MRYELIATGCVTQQLMYASYAVENASLRQELIMAGPRTQI